ncbi:hypothetical protein DM02DRAFT_436178 [Periconia macrospinosa]|uniref:Uncharacterized protein n=1 Tax=Periconia macrospinosa TaxID=97972 RepID=A0A2V1CXR1_9PLEO|nr:hypothetical protein DM02DRAFT_436178 [Periconia macrospinosa]
MDDHGLYATLISSTCRRRRHQIITTTLILLFVLVACYNGRTHTYIRTLLYTFSSCLSYVSLHPPKIFFAHGGIACFISIYASSSFSSSICFCAIICKRYPDGKSLFYWAASPVTLPSFFLFFLHSRFVALSNIWVLLHMTASLFLFPFSTFFSLLLETSGTSISLSLSLHLPRLQLRGLVSEPAQEGRYWDGVAGRGAGRGGNGVSSLSFTTFRKPQPTSTTNTTQLSTFVALTIRGSLQEVSGFELACLLPAFLLLQVQVQVQGVRCCDDDRAVSSVKLRKQNFSLISSHLLYRVIYSLPACVFLRRCQAGPACVCETTVVLFRESFF